MDPKLSNSLKDFLVFLGLEIPKISEGKILSFYKINFKNKESSLMEISP